MSRANLIMLAIGFVAILAGTLLLLRRGGTEAARTAKRMAGTMATALGIFLIIFAIGLSGDAAKQVVR